MFPQILQIVSNLRLNKLQCSLINLASPCELPLTEMITLSTAYLRHHHDPNAPLSWISSNFHHDHEITSPPPS